MKMKRMFWLLAAVSLGSACTSSAEGRVVPLAAVSAHIEAGLWTPWLFVAAFGPGENVTVSYDENSDGTAEWSETKTASSTGDVPFGLGSFSIKPGSRLTATSATYTRQLVVADVRVEYVNSTTNVVAGVAPADTPVRIQVMQAGPPLADVSVTADSAGDWSYDFTSLYDIEDGREVSAQVADAEGNISRVAWEAVVPTVGAGYSQLGANSLSVRNFAPGTSVRVRIDYAGDGGPLDGYDFDETAVVDNRFGFGFNLGGFDLLHPGDEIVATGGGWTKELTTQVLRIEKADPASDVVGGVAAPGASVVAEVMPPGGGGPSVAQLTTTADETTGRWSVDFTPLVDFDAGRQVMASIADADGDQTSTGWNARVPYFSASITDGPPSGVNVTGFAAGTSVRLRVDYADDGTWDVDQTGSVTQPFGYGFSLGGSGLLNAGDRILVEGGDWTKEGVLVPLAVSLVSFENDRVEGTATAGAEIVVSVSVPPGEPGGPPIATQTVTADSAGLWVADFTGEVDIVVDQQVNATIADTDGDLTEALGWARQDVWPKTGFESPIVNPPGSSARKAGSAIPVKFSLGGYRGEEIFATGLPISAQFECGTNPEMESGDMINLAGRRPLTYDATTGLYQLSWATSKNWANSCRQLVVSFADGTSLRANFRFFK